MILMLVDIQVRALDLSGNSVYRHVECHDLTSVNTQGGGTMMARLNNTKAKKHQCNRVVDDVHGARVGPAADSARPTPGGGEALLLVMRSTTTKGASPHQSYINSIDQD